MRCKPHPVKPPRVKLAGRCKWQQTLHNYQANHCADHSYRRRLDGEMPTLRKTLQQPVHPQRTNPRFAIPKALPYEIERQALLEQLNQTQTMKLVVLEASGGFGKTTLLAQWARRQIKATIWLTLNSSDSDPYYLSESLAKAIQVTLPDLELMHWRRVFEASHSAGRIAEALCDDLNALSLNLDICLDNGDDLSLEACQWIVQLTHFLGDNHRIIFAQRGGAPINIARLIAAGTGLVIAQDHLAFSALETEQLLGHVQPNRDFTSLHQHLEGWAAGLVLAGLHHANPNASPKMFIHDILEHLPAGLRQVLPEAAVLDIWSEESAIALGCALPKAWLEQARQAGLPLSPLGDQQYRPHQLLIEVLERELHKTPERYQQLQHQAAQQAEVMGDAASAVRHYAKAKQFTDLNRLLLTLVPVWEARYEWGVVKQLLESVPVTELAPQLQASLGRTYLETGQTTEARALFEAMVTAGTATARTYHGLAMLARRAGDQQETQTLVREGLKRTENPLERLALTLEEAMCLRNAGQTALAKRILEPVMKVTQIDDSGESLYALGFWYYVLLTLGENERVMPFWEKTLTRALETGFSKVTLGLIHVAFWCYEFSNELEKADAIIRKLLPVWQRDDFLPGVSILLYQRSVLALCRHDFESALNDCQEYLRLEEIITQKILRNSYIHIHYTLNIALIHLNRLDEVRDYLNRVETSTLSAFHRLRFDELNGFYEFYTDNLNKAYEIFTGILERDSSIASHLYVAEIARRQGFLKEEHINTLLPHTKKPGYTFILQRESVSLQKLYVECVRREWLTEYFKPYLNKPKTTQARHYTLTVNTLGALEATLNSSAIEFPYAKVTELLTYLCVNGSATRDELAETLWVDPRPTNVYNAIRHLRQALSGTLQTDDQLIVLKQKRYMLDTRVHVMLDILALEAAEPDDAPQILMNYRGDFLEGVETDWVQPVRERYKRLASGLAERYAQSFKNSQPEIALRWYKRAVSIDVTNVNAIEAIKALAQALGNTHDAQLAQSALEYLEQGENPDLILNLLET